VDDAGSGFVDGRISRREWMCGGQRGTGNGGRSTELVDDVVGRSSQVQVVQSCNCVAEQ
jgi:hypothetical protein